jgi:hypothetical protein
MFSKNSASSSGVIATKNSAEFASRVDVYVNLSTYIQTVKTLTDEYAKGEFVIVSQLLTPDTYKEMSISLSRLTQDSRVYPDYEKIRKTICSTFSGLYQSIIQYSQLVETTRQLSEAQVLVNILKDPVRLQEYIKQQKSQRELFPESQVKLQTMAQLKPEYNKYIRLYGFPAGGVFDMEKLASIVK